MSDETAGCLAPRGLDEDLPGRHARLRAAMDQAGLDWLVAVRDESVTYLSGYVSTTFRMHSRPVVAVLGHDRLHMVAAETEVDSTWLRVPGAEVHTYVEMDPPQQGLPDGHLQFAPHAARTLGEILFSTSGRIGVDGLDAIWPPIGQLTALVDGLAPRLVDGSDLVWRCRMVKSAWEVERMRAAARVLEGVFEVMPTRVRPGMTERQISTQFSIAQLELGAHEVGPHGSVAHTRRGLFGGPTERVWDPTELLYLDGAPIVDGYWADFCRTYATRPVTGTEAAGFQRVLDGLDAAVEAFRPGVSAAEIGAAMGRAMRIDPAAVGFGRFGHGIGLHVPEPPSLHPADPTPIPVGATICIEPAVVHEGINFVAEETYLVTEEGLERISPASPRQIIEL